MRAFQPTHVQTRIPAMLDAPATLGATLHLGLAVAYTRSPMIRTSTGTRWAGAGEDWLQVWLFHAQAVCVNKRPMLHGPSRRRSQETRTRLRASPLLACRKRLALSSRHGPRRRGSPARPQAARARAARARAHVSCGRAGARCWGRASRTHVSLTMRGRAGARAATAGDGIAGGASQLF